MNSLITFADGFSAFVIAIPYSDPMTNDKFLSIFELNVHTIFPQTKYILSDNAPNISSNTIKQYLHNLNIQMINSRPYNAPTIKLLYLLDFSPLCPLLRKWFKMDVAVWC